MSLRQRVLMWMCKLNFVHFHLFLVFMAFRPFFYYCQTQHASTSSGLYTERRPLPARFPAGRTEPVTRAHDWTSLHFQSSRPKSLCKTHPGARNWADETNKCHPGGSQALNWPPWQSSSALVDFKLSQTAEEPGVCETRLDSRAHFSSHRRI